MSIENTSQHKAQASETNTERTFADFDPEFNHEVESRSLYPNHIEVTESGFSKTPIKDAISDGHIDDINVDTHLVNGRLPAEFENTPAGYRENIPNNKSHASLGKRSVAALAIFGAAVGGTSVAVATTHQVDQVKALFDSRSNDTASGDYMDIEINPYDNPGSVPLPPNYNNSYDLTRSQVIDSLLPEVEQNASELKAQIIQELDDNGADHRGLLEEEIGKASASDDGQAILDQNAIHTMATWNARSKGEAAVREQAGLATAQDTTAYENLVKNVLNGGEMVMDVAVTAPDIQSKTFTASDFSGVESNGLGMKVVTTLNVVAANVAPVQIVFQLEQGIDAKNQVWVVKKVIDTNHQDWIEDFEAFDKNIR